MPKPTVVQSLLHMYRRGAFTDREIATRVIDLAADLLASVRRALDESPTTEEGWGRTLFIHGGTFTAEYNRRPSGRGGGPALRPCGTTSGARHRTRNLTRQGLPAEMYYRRTSWLSGQWQGPPSRSVSGQHE